MVEDWVKVQCGSSMLSFFVYLHESFLAVVSKRSGQGHGQVK